MSVFELLRRLFESRKLFSELLETFKKHPLLVISFITFVAPLTYVANYYLVSDDTAFNRANRNQKIIDTTVSNLMACQDKAGLSIMAVSIKQEMTKDGTSYPIRFEYVYAYQNGIITDKIQENKIPNSYRDTFYIPTQYTSVLKMQAKLGEPQYYNIKAINTVPQIILKILEKSEWYNEGIVEDLFLDAVVFHDNIIYVITFMNATESPNCDMNRVKSIFRELKKNLL